MAGPSFGDREASIDFDRLPRGGGVISVRGANEQGKTHLLELSFPATFYRTFPSYGESFQTHVHPGCREAYSELDFSIGARYLLRVQADPLHGGGRGKTEAFLTRHGESKPFVGPLVTEVDQELAKIAPSEALSLASVFACQSGEGSFFEATTGKRKELFAEVYGFERLQRLADGAGGHESEVLRSIETIRRRVLEVDMKVRHAIARRAVLVELRATVETGVGAVEVAREEAEKLRAALQVSRETLARAEEVSRTATAERERLAVEEAGLVEELAPAEERLAGLVALLAEQPLIEQAARDLQRIERDLDALREQERTAAEGAARAVAEVVRLESAREALLIEYRRVDADAKAAEAAASRAALQPELEATVEEARVRIAEIRDSVGKLEAGLPAKEAAATAEVEARVTRTQLETRRTGLEPRRKKLAEVEITHPMCAACVLTADAREAGVELAKVEAELAALPKKGASAAEALEKHRSALATLQKDLASLQGAEGEAATALAGLSADAVAARALPGLLERRGLIERDGLVKREALDVAKAVSEGAAAQAATVGVKRIEAQQLRAELAPKVEKLGAVKAAEASAAELGQTIERLKIRLGRVREARAKLPEPPDTRLLERGVTAASDRVTAADGRLSGLGETLEGLRSREAGVEGEIRALGEPETELIELREEEAALVAEATDWAVLGKGLGKNGAQALLIDAAGPGVTAIANDLLSTVLSGRFSIKIETTREKQRGGFSEVFDLQIFDSLSPTTPRKKGCGSETALVDEALRLAIAITNARNSGFEMRTLWRDETTSMLDAENSDAYVTMLRRAAKVGNFDQVFFITHRIETALQADAQVVIENGTVQIDGLRLAA